MNPAVRSVNVVTIQQLEGAISGYLSFGQSLLLVWPNLVALIALMLVAFACSYIGFMRQEVRSSWKTGKAHRLSRRVTKILNYASHLPEAPQGRISPFDFTVSPISWEST